MQFLFVLLAACFISACSDDDGTPKQIELVGGTSTEQTVYADQTNAEGGIKFTAQASWTASVADMTESRADEGTVDWLTLSAYSGGAGEHTINMTLKENRTGSDRKAKITITCGDTVITVIVEQKSVKEDGTKPAPAIPGGDYDKLITKIVEHEYYSTGDYVNDEGETTYEFFYDDSKRLVKIVQTESDDWAVEAPTVGTRASGTDVYVTTVNISYESNKLSCELSKTKNGVAVKDDDVYKASAVLDEALRIVSGEYTDSDYKDEVYLYNTTYTLHYDANGYLEKSIRIEEGETDEERITWANGNPTQVWWGTSGSGSAGTVDLIDKATYGSVANKTNLDLNWFIALDSEGWDFAAGDPYKTFSIMGYVGKRSANLADTMTDSSETFSGTSVVTRYTYQLADDGTPTVIKKEAKHGDSFSESSTYTITYDK